MHLKIKLLLKNAEIQIKLMIIDLAVFTALLCSLYTPNIKLKISTQDDTINVIQSFCVLKPGAAFSDIVVNFFSGGAFQFCRSCKPVLMPNFGLLSWLKIVFYTL